MELFKAHNQWKSRPADERFQSVVALNAACKEYRDSARDAEVTYSNLRVEPIDGDLKLVGRSSVPATLTHWSMGQLCARAAAPASYVRSLPPTLAAQNINHGLKENQDQNDKANLLFHQNGSLVLRATMTEKYDRIWNSDVTEKLVELQEANPVWQNPMAYKVLAPAKNGGWPQMSGEMEPAGLYASDHDFFAFLVDESKTFEGSPDGLNRGFFVWNSEVGASSFGVTTFLYDRVCGNNIVWGAKGVMNIRIPHIGEAHKKAFQQMRVELPKYTQSSTSGIESLIKTARQTELGTNTEETIDAVFSMAQKVRAPELSRTRIADAIELAKTRENRYGSPFSLWGVVGGLTEASQHGTYADERTKIDRAAGKLLKTIEF